MRFGSLGHKAASVQVDEQPGGEGLLLHPGELGHRDGGRISPRKRLQLVTVLQQKPENHQLHKRNIHKRSVGGSVGT